MKISAALLSFSMICYTCISSCFQQRAPDPLPENRIFAGSTPCNALINAILFIPASDTCAFMKWELRLPDKENDSSFSLQVSYGDYLPSTPNFAGGGKSLLVKGRVNTTVTSRNNSRYRILELNSRSLNGSLRLLLLDSNILHFIYPAGDLVKGDESHGFVLNRINNPSH